MFTNVGPPVLSAVHYLGDVGVQHCKNPTLASLKYFSQLAPFLHRFAGMPEKLTLTLPVLIRFTLLYKAVRGEKPGHSHFFTSHTHTHILCLLIFQYNVFVVVWFLVSTGYILRNNSLAYNTVQYKIFNSYFSPCRFYKRIFCFVYRSTMLAIINKVMCCMAIRINLMLSCYIWLSLKMDKS